jgi:hypothetical protein
MNQKSVKRYIAVVAALFFVFVGGVVWVGEDILRMQVFLGILAGTVTGSAALFYLWSRGQGVVERRCFRTAVVLAMFAWASFAWFALVS